MNNLYLITGTNEGDRLTNLIRVKELISIRIGKPVKISSIYETESWGYESPSNYYNQCLHVKTEMSAVQVLYEIFRIESGMGRKLNEKRYTDRVIDIDILFYNNERIDTDNLIVPHPRLHQRRFVLEPLSEIAPDYVHPVFGKKIRELLSECQDTLYVKKLENIE
jgi:2-amino-4-hydroxy-6-hydroxymethyldihydropteridine diphosphokinase